MPIKPRRKTTDPSKATAPAPVSAEQTYMDVIAYVRQHDGEALTVKQMVEAGYKSPDVHACIRRQYIAASASRALHVTDNGLAFAGLKTPKVTIARTVHDFVVLLFIKGPQHAVDDKLRENGYDFGTMSDAVVRGWAKKKEDSGGEHYKFTITAAGKKQAQFVLGMKLHQLCPPKKRGGKPGNVAMKSAMQELGLKSMADAWRYWEAVKEFAEDEEASDVTSGSNADVVEAPPRTKASAGKRNIYELAEYVKANGRQTRQQLNEAGFRNQKIESALTHKLVASDYKYGGALSQSDEFWLPDETPAPNGETAVVIAGVFTREALDMGRTLRDRFPTRPNFASVQFIKAVGELNIPYKPELCMAAYDAAYHVAWILNTSIPDAKLHLAGMDVETLPVIRLAMELAGERKGARTVYGLCERRIKQLEQQQAAQSAQAGKQATGAPESPQDAPAAAPLASGSPGQQRKRATEPGNDAQRHPGRASGQSEAGKQASSASANRRRTATAEAEEIPPLPAWVAPICDQLSDDRSAGAAGKQLRAWAERAWTQNYGWRQLAINTDHDEHDYLKRTLIKRLHRYTEAKESHPIISDCKCKHPEAASIGYSGGYASCVCPDCRHLVRFSFTGDITHCEADSSLGGRK